MSQRDAGNDKVYVTAVADVTSGGEAAGNKVFAADFKKSGNFELILDDPLLGTATDVVDGCSFSGEGDGCSTLYVTDIGGRMICRPTKCTPTLT
jgi:hypothetical protein